MEIEDVNELVFSLIYCKIEKSEQNIEKLKLIVEKITSLSIGNECPNGFCFSTCFVLSIYLDMFEISNEIVGGKMNGVDHFWLNILEYDNIILDATIQQFDKSQVRTYVGELKENEITMQYELKPYSLNDWLGIYENWRFPENCPGILFNRNEEFLKKVVKHNLINASLLISELEKKDQNTQQIVKNTNLFMMYFDSIFYSLKNSWIEDENLIKSVREKVELEFEILLFKMV